MSIINKKIKKSYFFILLLCFVLVLTSSFTYAKFFHKQEYPMELNFIQERSHFLFEPGLSHDFEIPYDGYYTFQLWGGNGGSAKRTTVFTGAEEFYPHGGLGGMIKATKYFNKGVVLKITVGNGGSIVDGGYNGGADGGIDTGAFFHNYFGGGGGGATDVRFSTGTLLDRILVAGGGGGTGSGNLGSAGTDYDPGYGGDGGTNDNLNGSTGLGAGSGEGGTLFEGGLGAQYGAFGLGGFAVYSGGGGGGGYYGGGGAFGSAGGGGGGSSFIANGFLTKIPSGLPDRDSTYSLHDGFAIISYLGEEENISW